VGAELAVESAPDRGTAVRLQVAIASPAAVSRERA